MWPLQGIPTAPTSRDWRSYSPADNAAAIAELLDTAPDLHAANLADSLEGLGGGNRRRHGAGEGKAGGDGSHAGHGACVRAALARGAGKEADEAEHSGRRCFGVFER